MSKSCRSKTLLLPLVSVMLILSPGMVAVAEIPNESPQKLRKLASHVVVGHVTRVYDSVEKTSANFEHTYSVAELTIKEVNKGDEIASGDRLYVRFWRKRWVGKGKPEPSHYGHRGLPKKGSTILVYLKGSRSSGYDVVSPNGFTVQQDRERDDG